MTGQLYVETAVCLKHNIFEHSTEASKDALLDLALSPNVRCPVDHQRGEETADTLEMMSVLQSIDLQGTPEALSDTGMKMQGTDETGREITVQGVVMMSHHGAQGDVMNNLGTINTPGIRETAAQGF